MSLRSDPRQGYLTLRFGDPEISQKSISAFLDELVTSDPRNALPEGDNVPIWESPVVGVSAADDPLFARLRESDAVGPIHVAPDFWLPGAKSVISFFLPFSKQVKASYDKRSSLPSLEWVSGRLNGEVFVNVARRGVQRFIEQRGGRAIVPNLDLRYKAVNLLPMWSERHVAYIGGVGTFGLHAGLLTTKGAAGRIGSVVTDVEIEPTLRPYSGIYDYCPWFVDGSCGACIARCPVEAIHDKGKDHAICLTNGSDNIRPAWGEWGYHSCGHCQNNLPCTNGLAPGLERKHRSGQLAD
jgi:epoxyqueuosine reductase QueG